MGRQQTTVKPWFVTITYQYILILLQVMRHRFRWVDLDYSAHQWFDGEVLRVGLQRWLSVDLNDIWLKIGTIDDQCHICKTPSCSATCFFFCLIHIFLQLLGWYIYIYKYTDNYQVPNLPCSISSLKNHQAPSMSWTTQRPGLNPGLGRAAANRSARGLGGGCRHAITIE